jgi:hypothetical protein
MNNSELVQLDMMHMLMHSIILKSFYVMPVVENEASLCMM